MINSREDYHYYLEQDRLALGIDRCPKSIKDFLRRIFLPNDILLFEKLLRRLEYHENVSLKSKVLLERILGGVIFGITKIRFRRLSMKLGFSIYPNTFGPGLSIVHYGTIIVNGRARIGANCRIHACVNIGASGGSEKVPCIGDNVYIGPSAVIFGDINIASNVTIAANATVNKSCDQEYVVLAGSPAKIVKEGTKNWLQSNHVKGYDS